MKSRRASRAMHILSVTTLGPEFSPWTTPFRTRRVSRMLLHLAALITGVCRHCALCSYQPHSHGRIGHLSPRNPGLSQAMPLRRMARPVHHIVPRALRRAPIESSTVPAAGAASLNNMLRGRDSADALNIHARVTMRFAGFAWLAAGLRHRCYRPIRAGCRASPHRGAVQRHGRQDCTSIDHENEAGMKQRRKCRQTPVMRRPD